MVLDSRFDVRIGKAARLVAWLVLAAAVAGAPDVVHAQSSGAKNADPAPLAMPLSVLVFRTARGEAELERLATALDSLLIAEVSRRAQSAAQHALDLPATQLALDCVAETPACLRTVSRSAHADSVLAAKLERSGTEIVLSVLYFPARSDGELRYVTRRQRGARAHGALLDAVPRVVDELLGTRPARTRSARAGSARSPRPAPARADGSSQRAARTRAEPSAWPIVPVALTGAGVAFLGAGVAFGLAARASEDEHAAARTGSDAEVDAAAATFQRAQTEASLATVGFVVGGAALAAGTGLWLFAAQRDEDAVHARLAPRVTRGGASLVLQGRFAEPSP